MKHLLITLILPLFIISCSHAPGKKQAIAKQTRIRSTAVPLNGNSTGIFSVLFLGDILLANEAEKKIRENGANYPFEKIVTDLNGYTFCVANLETPVTQRGEILVPQKPFIFRIDPEIADTIKAIDPTCLIIGNNHIMDYGTVGMQDTISWIESKGWQYCGAGDNLEQARQPAILQYGETRIVLLSYNERPPIEFYATYTTAGTAPLSLDVVREDIIKYRQPGTVIIVNPHWGIEMTTTPRRDQRKTARAILDMGADAVIGQHPHCPQGIELYKGKPIFYSIGNFITGFSYPSQMDNMAVALYINENAQILRIEIIPVNGKHREIMHSVSLLSGIRAKRLLNNVEDLSRDFGVRIVRDQNRGFIELKKLVIASTKTKGD